jgi:hypothetical protein
MAAQALRIGGMANSPIGRFTNPADQITAKPLIQMKNLFRQKDSLELCLDSVKVKQQLSVHCLLRNQVRH